MLKLEGINKTFGDFNALHDISFELPKTAKIIGVIGPNGAGKSTLLDIVAGLEPPDTGECEWRALRLSDRNRRELFFYSPDGVRPDFDRPVYETLRFFTKLYSSPGRSLEAELKKVIEELELTPQLWKKFSELSKGYRKRILLAISWIVPRELIILDEPFDALDYRQTDHVIRLFDRRRVEDQRFLLSIHQLADAQKVCDYFILLNQGRLVAHGDLNSVLNSSPQPSSRLEEVFHGLA